MLATIIPHFLLAIVSDKTAWPNGPEFKFDSDVNIHISGVNGSNKIHGLNLTNEFTCRPKADFFLQCQFQHKDLVGYETNTDTGETISHSNLARDIFEPFFFGIEFDQKGVNKIKLNETLSKHKAVLDVAKALASALNVAADVSGVKTGDDRFEFGKVQNLLANQCKGDAVTNMQTSSEEDTSNDAEWNLELMPPLQKLAGRNLNIMKTWNMSDCDTAYNFFWLGIFVGLGEDGWHREEFTVNSVNLFAFEMYDKITITKGNLDYMSTINMKVNEKKARTPPEKKELDIQELSQIRLRAVQPATETWPEIENAVTIDLKEQK